MVSLVENPVSLVPLVSTRIINFRQYLLLYHPLSECL